MTNIRCACMSDMEMFKNSRNSENYYMCMNKKCRFLKVAFGKQHAELLSKGKVFIMKVEAYLLNREMKYQPKIVDLPIINPAAFIRNKNMDVTRLRIRYYSEYNDSIFHGIVEGWLLSEVVNKGVF